MTEVSWLRLERYALDDLDPAERREVEASLRDDPALRARLEAIEGDPRRPRPLDASSLPPDSGLDLPDPPGAIVVPFRPRTWWRAVAGGLAVAAAVALAVLVPRPGERPPAAVAYKGGTLAVAVDRKRGGAVTVDPETYAGGDRFRVRLSCPPGRRDWAVVVLQGAERTAPLGEGAQVTCGNNVVLPGGFALTGSGEVTVCAGVDDGAARLRAGGWGEGVVCLALREGAP